MAPGHQGPDQIRLLQLLRGEQEGGLVVPQAAQQLQRLLRGLAVDDEIDLLALRRQGGILGLRRYFPRRR